MLVVLEAAFVLGFLSFIVTQVVLPLYAGEQLFPLFRKRVRALESELAKKKEELHEAELEKQIAEVNMQIQKTKSEAAACNGGQANQNQPQGL